MQNYENNVLTLKKQFAKLSSLVYKHLSNTSNNTHYIENLYQTHTQHYKSGKLSFHEDLTVHITFLI